MRILHVTDCFLPQMGGIETQVSGLALHQAERGDDVAVFTTTLPASGRIGATRAHLGTPGSTVDIYRLARRMPGGIPVHPNSPRHAAALTRLMDLPDTDLLDLLLRRKEPDAPLDTPDVREMLALLRPSAA